MTARLPDLAENTLTPAQRQVYQKIASGPRGKVVGPLRVWLQSPDLAERAQALGQYARFDSNLAPHLSELAILVTGRIWGSEFEWSHHVPLARDAGIPEVVIAAIGQGTRPAFDDPEQAAVFDFAVELHRDRQVSDATFNRATQILGTPRVVDLVGICGYYTLISMTINAFEIPSDEGPSLPETGLSPSNMFA